jgi:hypothetical protein
MSPIELYIEIDRVTIPPSPKKKLIGEAYGTSLNCSVDVPELPWETAQQSGHS